MAPRRPCPRNPNGHQGQQARIQRNRVMDKVPTFVGIDVAKHRLDVHLRPAGASFAIDYGEEEVTALVERVVAIRFWIDAKKPVRLPLPGSFRMAGYLINRSHLYP
jgi:hypothetical protein